MSKYLTQLLICIILISCGQQQEVKGNKKNVDTDKVTFTEKQLNDKLELYFKETNSKSLEEFFLDWNKMLTSNGEEFIQQNDTIASIYSIYKAFYKPLDLLKLGNWEWGNELNSKCKYVVVQNKIYYSILEKGDFNDYDWEKTRKDSICKFRPPVDLDKNKVLYLTDEYSQSLKLKLIIELVIKVEMQS